jgi:dUTP pyrophosphatase
MNKKRIIDQVDIGLNMYAIVKDKRLSLPEYATPGSAGIDLRACSMDGMKMQGRSILGPGATFEIGTGISIHIGSGGTGMVGLLLPRSSLGKRGFALQNTVGVIDEDYQGEIILLCRNNHRNILTIDPLERIAQLVIMPVLRASLVETDKFVPTSRGEGGIGSTGT